MYLKSLQLVGFKSFAEKTVLEFLPGVTAIVGPNGCGKSNIADAIRWVLGEQSAKALRGAEMSDVIFNGADGRKPIGAAEVHMTFAEVDPKLLSLPGVTLDFSEVTITRRVFREGQGEYLINKTPCRLRDIQGLFMDTGIGRSSYSLMAQGQIDQILSAHPEDRRLIFEEAAGINKYKHQKKEALRKLEYTEANLVRLTDIIKEVKRQIISLQRQAGKARRYKELFDQLKVLDTRLARHKFDLLQAEITGLDTQLAGFTEQATRFSGQIAATEQQIADLRRSLGEIERAIHDAVARDHELKSERDRHEQRVGSNLERIAEFEQLIANHHLEIAGAEEKIRVQEQHLAALNTEFDQVAGLLATEQGRLQSQQDALRQTDAALASQNAALEDSKSALMDLERHNAQARNELGALDQKKRQDILRAERLSTERLQLEDQRRALEQELAAFNLGLTELRANVESLRAHLAERESDAAVRARELDAAIRSHHTSVTAVSQKQARLEVLRQLFAAPDGRLTLGQILEVQPPHGAAIEAALHHALHTILADDLAAARALLAGNLQNPAVAAPDLLPATGKPTLPAPAPAPAPTPATPPPASPANFSPDLRSLWGLPSPAPARDLSALPEGAAPSAPIGPTPGTEATTERRPPALQPSPAPFAGEGLPVPGQGEGNAVHSPAPSSANNLFSAGAAVRVRDARFEPLVRSLLEGVVIADDLDAALAIRAAQPHLAVATRSGEFVSAHGILSAVSASHIAEISALSEEVARLEASTAESAAAREQRQQQKTASDQQLAQARAELHARDVALAAKVGELNILTVKQRDLASNLHTVVFELGSLEQQDAEEKRRREQLLADLAAAESRDAELHERLATTQRELETLSARKEEMAGQFTELRVAVGGLEHKREAIQAQREPISGRLRDLRERMQTCATEITTYTARIQQFREEITESEQQMVELGAAREQSQQQLKGLEHQRHEVATAIEQAEAELRALHAQATAAQEQKSGIEVSVVQKRMELQHIKERVWQKYQQNIEAVRADTITITIADQTPAVSEQVPLPTDWDSLEAQVTEMQSKLDAMGAVNVEAIQEYDELEERFKFLSQQHEDLVNAKEQLLQVIAKINSTTKQLFSETFEKIRINFQTMFTELFGGGKANLILLDETDPLESGIEIVAKPPGKQLQSITLLSGGEKTMTATALLFSIYMVKPAPFCVLDELDAPLDESNINRFIRILQRFITQSQFVIITHNKRTIGMADALYGITMEEHGVSKVVSVKFSPRDESARRDQEKARAAQEERIDGAAAAPAPSPARDVLPHEEDLRNDLLADKEQNLAPVNEDAAPVIPESAPVLSDAPAPIADEVQAVVAAVAAANQSAQDAVAQETVAQAAPAPAAEPAPESKPEPH